MLSADPFAHRLLDLSGHRETAGLLFGVDDLVVQGDVEDASATADHLRLDSELAMKLFRQPGGSRVVVSHSAVFDTDMRHRSLLSWTIVRRPLAFTRAYGASSGPSMNPFFQDRNETLPPPVG